MQITRRNALVSAGAAIVTGATVAPLALKAAGVKAALAGDPVLPAFEAYEAARLEAIAASDYRLAIVEAVEADLPPEPHRNRTYLELSDAERKEADPCTPGRKDHAKVTVQENLHKPLKCSRKRRCQRPKRQADIEGANTDSAS